MCGKLKKFSFLILLFISSFLGILIPLKPALAVWDWLVSRIVAIPAVFAAFFFTLTSVIAVLLAGFGGMVLNWIISPNFTQLSYTNPANNGIIKVGLGITQTFVNMLLVLVLVYIAIATILRLAGYETKKLLVWFIIIALLVNFSPVICGLIVDASNIIMNFFLQEVTGGENLKNQFQTIEGNLRKGYNWKTFKEPDQMTNTAVQLGIITILNLVLFFVLMLFAAVFLARYIVIWILVILSPLAFVCYILPITRKFWSLWWQQFFAWSFIGVTCGFFLYLADLLATTTIDLKQTLPTDQLGSAVLPHLVPLGFLIIGLVFGLKTSAMGASTVMSLGKRGQKWVGGKIWRKGIKPRVEPILKKVTGGAVGAIEKITGARIPKTNIAPLAPLRWFIPEAMRKYAEMRPAIDAEMALVKQYSPRTRGKMIARGTLSGVEGTAGLIETTKGDAQDLFNECVKEFKITGKDDEEKEQNLLKNPTFKKRVGSLLNTAFYGGYHNDILRRSPRLGALAKDAGIPGYQKNPDGSEMTPEQGIEKATQEARDQHINDWEREELKNKTVTKTIFNNYDRDRILSVMRKVKNGQATLQNSFNGMFTDWAITEGRRDEALETMSLSVNDLAKAKIFEDFRTSEKKGGMGQKGPKKGFLLALEDVGRFQKQGWTYPTFKTGPPPPAAKSGLQEAYGKPSKELKGLGEVKKEEGLKGLEDVKKEKKGKK